jgi:REP element-mobilizing transposase RayT
LIYSRIHIHALWGTENNETVLTTAIRKLLLPNFNKLATENNIKVEAVDIQSNHIHCLFELPEVLSIADCIKIFRDGTAQWANGNMAMQPALAWANNCYAVSVSESQREVVKKYIENQSELHKTKTFEQECNEMHLRFGFNTPQ